MRALALAAAVALAGLAWPAGTASAEEMKNTCISCHAEEEDSDLRRPVEEWRRSVHAKADVTCDACHGGDPFEEDEDLSMDEDEAGFLGAPGWQEVTDFCGACHEEIADHYRQSVMGQKGVEGERVAVCTNCHMPGGTHDIQPPEPAEIFTEERCGECHDPERAFVLRDLLEHMDGRLQRVSAELAPLRRAIDVSPLTHEVRDVRQRWVLVAHTYDRERIEELARVNEERLTAIEEEVPKLADEARFRRRLGVGVVAFWLLAMAGAVHLRRHFTTDEGEES